jgi:hypothetical protein
VNAVVVERPGKGVVQRVGDPAPAAFRRGSGLKIQTTRTTTGQAS